MLIGCGWGWRFPGLADSMERPVKILSALFLPAQGFALIRSGTQRLGAVVGLRADPSICLACRRLFRVARSRHRRAAGNSDQILNRIHNAALRHRHRA